MKTIYIIALCFAMSFAPVSMLAQSERDGIEVSVSGITNLTGAKVATVRIDSNDKTFALNLQKGCYLIKVGKIVRKISVQ